VALAIIAGLGGPLSLWPGSWRAAAIAIGFTAAGALLVVASARVRRTGRPVHAALWLTPVVLSAAAAASSAVSYAREYGLMPFARGDRIAAYQQLWHNIDRYYAYRDDSPVDLAELRVRYESRVRSIDDSCGWWGGCPEYRAAIRDMLAELGDSHTHVRPRHELAIPRLSIAPIEGEPVVMAVPDGSAAAAAGVTPGMAVRRVDGLPIGDALARIPDHALGFRAPRTRELAAFELLLSGRPGTTARVTVEDLAGARREVELPRRAGRLKPAVISHRTLSARTELVTLPSLTDATAVTSFDEILDRLAPRAVILDLRGNRGGDSRIGNAIVGRLIDERVTYGRECFRAWHPLRRIPPGCHPRFVDPRGTPFRGPVAVLIDGRVASSAEWLALALCDGGRARCFGGATAGESGNPVPYFMPHVMLQLSTGDFRRRDGSRLQGVGLAPDEPVATSRADLAAGRDPVLSAARAWVEAELTD
jgi:carboxyl-terminal processing protease